MSTEPDDRIALASDHAGFKVKEKLKTLLDRREVPYEDLGAPELEPSDDYPVFAARLGRAVAGGSFRRGIAVCGSGIGASMTANRFKGVRAALCVTPEMAKLSRLHNDANVLVLGERVTPDECVEEILDAWLDTGFEAGRHQRRVLLIDELGGNG